MKKTNIYHELICFSKDKDFGNGDFNGADSKLDFAQRKQYLSEYARAARGWYNNPNNKPKKAVNKLQLAVTRQKQKQKTKCTPYQLPIEQMTAYIKPKEQFYKGWQLYTSYCKQEDGCIVFEDGDIPPLPCAKYECEKSQRIKQFEFEFFVNDSMRSDVVPNPLVTTMSGKVFEFRDGINDVAKLQIYPNGELHYRDESLSCSHPKNVCLGKDMLGGVHALKVVFGNGDKVSISIDSGEPVVLNAATSTYPDTFFVSGGMHPSSLWRIKPLKAVFDDGSTLTDFFQKSEQAYNRKIYLNKVRLPFSIGTQKYKDSCLVLERSFEIKHSSKVFLRIDTIDPCGEIKVNNVLVKRVDNFLAQKIDITNYVRQGANLLEVTVEPRAPEVLYSWHRHSDPYNGWFMGQCTIEIVNNSFIDDVRCTTKSVGKDSANFDVSFYCECGQDYNAEIYLQKIYPHKQKKRFVGAVKVSGRQYYSQNFEQAVSLWSTDNPNIYSLTIKLKDSSGKTCFSKKIDTGFRTIRQKNGEIVLNNNRILLNGALNMQFLPPYENVPISHLCPKTSEILHEFIAAKNMGCNVVRMHQLGYGSNDKRFAQIADRLGLMLIWTTRLIDCAESIKVQEPWRCGDGLQAQIKEVYNHPSIIMWEGSNEFHGILSDIDKMYDTYVSCVKAVDCDRLILPCAHLYYGSGIYDEMPSQYYQDDGESDNESQPASSSWGWKDKLVVRSSHTYCLLLGYGGEWRRLRLQDWKSQKQLLSSDRHAYVVTEFAIIGQQRADTKEAKQYFNPHSYELNDEITALGGKLAPADWELSQAYQSVAALHANKRMRSANVDGMIWCCLSGGANDGGYLKPTIDFYGYKKLAFYALKEGFQKSFCVIEGNRTHMSENQLIIKPVLLTCEENISFDVTIEVKNRKGKSILMKAYKNVFTKGHSINLAEINCNVPNDFYSIVTKTRYSRRQSVE